MSTPSRKKHPYGSFALVVTLYVLAVAAFSTWSYFELQAGRPYPKPTEQYQKLLARTALVEGTQALFLLIMPIPLIALYHRARSHTSRKEVQLNEKLESDFRTLKKHEAELQDAILDLERFNALATGREERILELKIEVNALLMELNRPKRYETAPDKKS